MAFEGLLRGLDEFGAGADFPGGILQGGECEAWVAKFSETFHNFLLLAQGSSGKEKNSCTCEQKWDSASTNWPGIYFLRFEDRDVSVTPEKGFVSSDVARKAVDDLNLEAPPFTWNKSAKDGPPEKS